MEPAFRVNTLRVGAIEQERGPGLVIERSGLNGPRNMRFAAATEFYFWSRAAVRAGYKQHGRVMNGMDGSAISVRYCSCGSFIDKTTAAEAIESEGSVDRMRFPLGEGPREYMPRSRCGFESSGSPATIDE